MTDIALQAVRAPTIVAAATPTRAPRTPLPPLSCDCHAHVFGQQARYPYLPNASYIPPDATLDDYTRMLSTLGCERAVLVQPSVYGSDNRCMLDALRSNQFALRGVAVVDPDVSDDELGEMHRAGVRGIRINVASVTAGLGLEHAPQLAERIRDLGWHLQFFVDVGATPDLGERLARLPVRCVIDHFGHLNAEHGITSPAAQTLLRLASLDHVWFKLSGGYRVSRESPPYPSVTPLARALVERAADRCVWGTDWPHPVVERMDNDGDIADALAAWLDDEPLRRSVLADNPARLYDFAPPQ